MTEGSRKGVQIQKEMALGGESKGIDDMTQKSDKACAHLCLCITWSVPLLYLSKAALKCSGQSSKTVDRSNMAASC